MRSSTTVIPEMAGVLTGPWSIVFLMGVASAVLGLFVASLAYRGYVDNDSTPMFFLTLGIAFLTTVPFLVSYGSNWLLPIEEPIIVLLVTTSHLLGLLALFRSFKRT